MINLNEFDSSMSFVSNVDESALRLLSHPSSLLIQLADESEWLEDKVGGFKEVVVRYHGKEHSFTPDEVLRALYAARDEPIIRCKDCKHGHMTTDEKHCKWCSIMATHQIDSNEYVNPPNGYDPEPYFDADFFCGFAERRDA